MLVELIDDSRPRKGDILVLALRDIAAHDVQRDAHKFTHFKSVPYKGSERKHSCIPTQVSTGMGLSREYEDKILIGIERVVCSIIIPETHQSVLPCKISV